MGAAECAAASRIGVFISRTEWWKRDKATAVALKRQGVKAGVPDICLPVARNGYHGLHIELKAGKTQQPRIRKDG